MIAHFFADPFGRGKTSCENATELERKEADRSIIAFQNANSDIDATTLDRFTKLNAVKRTCQKRIVAAQFSPCQPRAFTEIAGRG